MYSVDISDPKISVQTKNHSYHYAVDGSLPNPLEATYAALAGCAGVYTLKACKKLGKPTDGIKITGRPTTRIDNPLSISKWVTLIEFPETWTSEEKSVVIDAVQKCAVKDLIASGHTIHFTTESN